MSKEKSPEYLAMFNSFMQPDPHSYAVYKMLQDIYPAFGKKLFEGNPFMFRLVMTGFNPMDILEYPICGRCETLAAWNGYAKRGKKHIRQCTCLGDKCGHTTVNPPTLRDWMKDELKKKAPPDIAEYAEQLVDDLASGMVRMAVNELNIAVGKVAPQKNAQMGIADEYGEPIESKTNIQVNVGNHDDVDLNNFISDLEEDLENV